MWIHYTHTGAGPALSASVPQSVFTITEKAPRGPSRGLLRDCTTSPITRFAALILDLASRCCVKL